MIRVSDELRRAAAPIWDAQLAHPFVRGIGDGKFLATRDGIALAKAFARVKNITRRRRLIRLLVEIMGKIDS